MRKMMTCEREHPAVVEGTEFEERLKNTRQYD